MKKVQITTRDGLYPGLLLKIYDPPPLLNVCGNFPDFQQNPPIAVVGTRKPTDYGRECTESIVTGLVKAGFSIISGLAYGIDSIAHKAALKTGGITIAVLGSGLENISPATHKGLAEDIIKSGGAVITEFEDRAPGYPSNFPMRNRIISGLSLGVIVVEAAIDSGSLITARSALEQGREVFAVPGPICRVSTAGTHKLLRSGAALVENAQDVIDALEPQLSDSWKTKFAGQLFDIGDKERRILEVIGKRPILLDNIIETSGISSAEAISSIAILKLNGLVDEVNGKGYIKINLHD